MPSAPAGPDGLRLGLHTPVLSLVPGESAAWELNGTIEQVRCIAETADQLGYDFLTCSEHIAIPEHGRGLPGPRHWDPLATLAYLAGFTSRIRLATSVLVLAYHHPLEIAKRYGTLDRLSGGRLVLGVAAGYLASEFELLGVPFADRGARTDDAIRALRASFGRRKADYCGSHYGFSDMLVDPCGIQNQLPIWVGGVTPRSLRRAVELADGWIPFGVAPAQAAHWLHRAAQTPAWNERERPLDVVLRPAQRLDPLTDPDCTRANLAGLAAAGATAAWIRFEHRSVDHYLDQLAALRELMPPGQF